MVARLRALMFAIPVTVLPDHHPGPGWERAGGDAGDAGDRLCASLGNIHAFILSHFIFLEVAGKHLLHLLHPLQTPCRHGGE